MNQAFFLKLIFNIIWKSEEANRTEALCFKVTGKQRSWIYERDPTMPKLKVMLETISQLSYSTSCCFISFFCHPVRKSWSKYLQLTKKIFAAYKGLF